MLISPTEIGDFLRCRRKWDISSVNRKSLAPRGLPSRAFTLGSAIHYAFARQGKGEDPVTAASQFLDQTENYLRSLQSEHTYSVNSQLEKFSELREEALAYIEHYFAFYGSNPIAPLEYIDTEVSFRVPIPNCKYEEGYLIGTIDGLARDPTTGDLWAVEHKSVSVKPELYWLEVHMQMTAYMWALRKLGETPKGFVYDGIHKKLPSIPTILTNGKVSKKAIPTTAVFYAQAVLANGQSLDEYADILSAYYEQDKKEQNDFFTRFRIGFSDEAMGNFEKRISAMHNDMTNPDLQIYPNFQWMGCKDCGVKDLCRAMEFGEDWEFLIRQRYEKHHGHGTIQAQDLPPTLASELLRIE